MPFSLPALATQPVKFEHVRHFGKAKVAGQLFKLCQFAGIQLFRSVALAADDVVMVVFFGVELEERLAAFRGDARGDSGFFEGFEVSVDGDQVVLRFAEHGVQFFGAEWLVALNEFLEQGLAWFGDSQALLFQRGYRGIKLIFGRAHFQGTLVCRKSLTTFIFVSSR